MHWMLLALLLLWGCNANGGKQLNNQIAFNTNLPNSQVTDTLWALKFDYPVGPPDASGYYNAQRFTENNHLGDDWNGKGGGNTDLGDTVFAIANGYVTEAGDLKGGWGNVARIVHYLPNEHRFAPAIESLYAHLDEILIEKGNWVKIGQPIGTIGNVHGQYYAHLHLEIREKPGLPLGGGYATDTNGYINPTWFIKSNR